MKAFYELWYRFGTPPWVGQARAGLVQPGPKQWVTYQPGRVIDLGCNEGDGAIFLAQHGFQVTAVDFSAAASIRQEAKARPRRYWRRVPDRRPHPTGQRKRPVWPARGLRHLRRPRYRGSRSLCGPRSCHWQSLERKFLLWCFEWELKGWERLAMAVLALRQYALRPG